MSHAPPYQCDDVLVIKLAVDAYLSRYLKKVELRQLGLVVKLDSYLVACQLATCQVHGGSIATTNLAQQMEAIHTPAA